MSFLSRHVSFHSRLSPDLPSFETRFIFQDGAALEDGEHTRTYITRPDNGHSERHPHDPLRWVWIDGKYYLVVSCYVVGGVRRGTGFRKFFTGIYFLWSSVSSHPRVGSSWILSSVCSLQENIFFLLSFISPLPRVGSSWNLGSVCSSLVNVFYFLLYHLFQELGLGSRWSSQVNVFILLSSISSPPKAGLTLEPAWPDKVFDISCYPVQAYCEHRFTYLSYQRIQLYTGVESIYFEQCQHQDLLQSD